MAAQELQTLRQASLHCTRCGEAPRPRNRTHVILIHERRLPHSPHELIWTRSRLKQEFNEADVELRLNGKNVSRCCIDTAFSLEVLEKDAQTVIRIGGQMNIKHGENQLSLSGE